MPNAIAMPTYAADQPAASRSVGTCALRTWKTKSNSSRPAMPAMVSIQARGETSTTGSWGTRGPEAGALGPGEDLTGLVAVLVVDDDVVGLGAQALHAGEVARAARG